MARAAYDKDTVVVVDEGEAYLVSKDAIDLNRVELACNDAGKCALVFKDQAHPSIEAGVEL